MKIHDENKNLLAIVIRSEQIEKGKNFVTNNDNEFQLASFLLDENEVIEKHYHPQQERNIKNTSEVLVLLEGEMLIEIFNSNLELVDTMSLYSGDTIGFYAGGHGIKLITECKFIEVKQGPFNESTDKKRF
jgi:hypothetical protein